MSNPAEKKRLFLFLDFMRDQWGLHTNTYRGSFLETKTLLDFCAIVSSHLDELTAADFSPDDLSVVWNNWLSAISRSSSLERFDLASFLAASSGTKPTPPLAGALAPTLTDEERQAMAAQRAQESTAYALEHFSQVGQRLLDLGVDLQLPSWCTVKPSSSATPFPSPPGDPPDTVLSMSEAVFHGNRFTFLTPALIQRISDVSPPANIEQGFWNEFLLKAVKNDESALVDLAIANHASPDYLDQAGNNALFFVKSTGMLTKLLALGTPSFVYNRAGALAPQTWHDNYPGLFSTLLAAAQLDSTQRQELSFLHFTRSLTKNWSSSPNYFKKLLKNSNLTIGSLDPRTGHTVLFESLLGCTREIRQVSLVKDLLSRKRLDVTHQSVPHLPDVVLAYVINKFYLSRRVRQTKQLKAIQANLDAHPLVAGLFTAKAPLVDVFRGFQALVTNPSLPVENVLLEAIYGNNSSPGFLWEVAEQCESRVSRLSMLGVDLPAEPDERFGSLGWGVLAAFGQRPDNNPDVRLPGLNVSVLHNLFAFSAPSTWPAPTPEAVGNTLDAIMSTSYYSYGNDVINPIIDYLVSARLPMEPAKLAFLTNKVDEIYHNQEIKAKISRLLMDQAIDQANSAPSSEPKQLRLRL